MEYQIHFSKSSGNSILSKPLELNSKTISDNTFAYLFSSMINYFCKSTTGVSDLEQKLNKTGFDVGYKVTELLSVRDQFSKSPKKSMKRATNISEILDAIRTTYWQYLFNKNADSVDKSNEGDDQWLIIDKNPFLIKYISVPAKLGELNCCAYAAGIIRGIITSSGFPCEVTAYNLSDKSSQTATVYLVKFDESVMAREEAL